MSKFVATQTRPCKFRWNYNRRTILFIEPLAKYLSILAILPFYNCGPYGKTLFRIYGSLVTLACVLCCAVTVCAKLVGADEAASSIYLILEVFCDICGALLCVSTSVRTMKNYHRYHKFFLKLRNLEDFTQLNRENCIEYKWLNNTYFHFLFIHVIMFMLISFDSMINGHFLGLYTWYYFIIIYEGFSGFFLSSLVMAIFHKFRDARAFLKTAALDPNPSEIVTKTRLIFLQLHDIVNIFNNLFGWQMIFIVIYSATISFQNLTLVGIDASVLGHGKYSVYQVSAACMAFVSYHLVSPVALTICCHKTVKEAEEISRTCYVLQNKIGKGDKGYDELEGLANLINSKKLEFTAAGFFPINRSTICSMLSSVTTYFIVVKQFDNC